MVEKKVENVAYNSFIASSISASCAKTLVAPIERTRLLLIANKSGETFFQTFRSLPRMMKVIINTEGVLVLWRGNLSNLISYLPTQAINFTLNEYIKQNLLKRTEVG